MKRGLIIGGVIFLVIIIMLIATPFVFRDALLQKTRNAINKNLNATLEFKDFNLSLIKDFPKASLAMGDVLITGKDSFEGDTLLFVKSFRTSFGLFDLLTPNDLTINEIILDNAWLNLIAAGEDEVNWDILKEDETAATPAPGETGDEDTFGVQLSKIEINGANVSYVDKTSPMHLQFNDVEMLIDGKMYGAETRLNTKGTAETVNLNYDGINYISKTKVGLTSLLDINFDTWEFRFSEGEMMVNKLPLDLTGMFSLPGDSIYFDLEFASKASSLGEILALTPPEYESYMKDLNATGSASFTGSFKGYYFEDTYPDLKIRLNLSGGNARYAGMPEEIKNISGNLAILKPQGDFNKTSIEISNTHFEIRNNPMDINLRLSNLLEDMRFDGKVVGKLNFDHLKDALPLDSVDVAGLLDINLGMKGNYSAIENKKYERLSTDGHITLNDFVYNSPQIAQAVNVSSGRLDFTPERINLRQMDMKIGDSDMAFSGSVSDYYAYLFSGGSLNGSLQLSSNYLNINELMQLIPEDEQPEQNNTGSKNQKAAAQPDSLSGTAFKVPEKINLSVNTNIKRALYDRLGINNINGVVALNNGRMDLKGVNMNMLSGELQLAGSYANTPDNKPLIDMNIDMKNFDIPTAFQSLGLIRNYIPIAAQSKGSFSTALSLKGQLDENMGPLMSSLNGTGIFQSSEVQIVNSPVFNKIKSVLNEERLRDMRINDFIANFTIENGNLILKPFETKISGQQAVFAGRLNVDNLIEMQIGFLINRDALSKNIENTIGILPGQQNIQVIPVGVTIKGVVNNPDVSVDLSDARALVTKEVKNATKEELQKTINRLGDGLKKLIK